MMRGNVAEGTGWNRKNGPGYILNRERDHSAATLLNLQLYLWKSARNFNIHPSIKASLSSTAVIADVTSGSAIWLIDVSPELPETQLDGFDHDLRQSLNQQWLPPKNDLVSKYDYVHILLPLLVLKPGDRLEWDGLNTVNVSVRKADSALPTPGLDHLRDWTGAGGLHAWTVMLADFVAEEGFVDANMDFIRNGLELARTFNGQHLLMPEEFAEGLAKLSNVKSAAKYLQIFEEAHSKSMSGAALCLLRVVCAVRRPL
ncbi:hypothetical protein LX32DRAFT_669678 [Colletotrichum zoysiae]|uniref:Methyltransferase domain-containing protein n=1 Tax=Colletotrichum zoysiae TaxID=1216348 RepID=A0AAD9M504_9PEZI|nr:hypothetical protein LX32DRAFT_669678 [Colletotrichum zoysiae]